MNISETQADNRQADSGLANGTAVAEIDAVRGAPYAVPRGIPTAVVDPGQAQSAKRVFDPP